MHYSRVFILHQALHSWTEQPQLQWEIQAELNAVDNSWLDNDSGPRPSDERDRRTCGSAAWRQILEHLQSEATAALGGQAGRPMYEVARLLGRLQEAQKQAGCMAAGVGG
ncbi:hypothetical protein LX36DRAFT_717419 [Colletotrichum falcatum]|nr:hypothetical protein LX36DRAFT_717419 [Colletotrichum falcatum]